MAMVIVGIMGPGEGATQREQEIAYRLGRAVASEGWVLVTGGRDKGVMDAASRGAKEAGGLTIGILPTRNKEGMSAFVDVPILTGMGEARNNINVLSSEVLFACGGGAGTASEIALAIKAERHVILLHVSDEAKRFFVALSLSLVYPANDVDDAIRRARQIFS